jgi:flagellar hook capping protein FlgD
MIAVALGMSVPHQDWCGKTPTTSGARYAFFAEASVITSNETLAGIAFTPRVFPPTGAFASRDVGIGFTLGRSAPVTVRVYGRSGRLVREVVAGQQMNAGANLGRWDGRDRNGDLAVDGICLVTVEALGRTVRKTLAVVK